jgi:hypothetical protein
VGKDGKRKFIFVFCKNCLKIVLKNRKNMFFCDKMLTFRLTNRKSVTIIYAELRRKAVIKKEKN